MATYNLGSRTCPASATQNVVVGDTVTIRVFANPNVNDPSLSVGASGCTVSGSAFSGVTFTISNFSGSSYSATFTDDDNFTVTVSGSVSPPNTATVSVPNITEGQNLAINVTVTSIYDTTWHWHIDRVSGNSSNEGTNPSHGDFTPVLGTNTYYVSYNDDSASEVQYQGEEFTIAIRSGPSNFPAEVGDEIARTNYLLFDNDTGLASVSNLTIASSATSQSPSISYQFDTTAGTGAVAYVEYRVVRTSPSGGVIYTGTGVNGLPPNSGTVTPTISDIPPAGSTYTYRVDIYNGNVYLQGPSYTVTRQAPALVAPVISTVTDNNAAASSVTATVNLSSTGSGGTLYYNQTTSNSAPAINDSGWQTGNTFSHPRGTTRYYWAQRSDGSNRAISSSVSKTVGYLSPDNSIADIPNQTISAASTSFTITISSGGSTTEYQVRDDVTTHESRTGNGTITVTDAPAQGGTKDYTIFARLPTAAGGDNSYTGTGEFFSITRESASGGGGGGTGDNTTSENRVVLGKAIKSGTTKYGLFISKEGVNVIDGSGNLTSETNLIFDSTSFKSGIVHKTVSSAGTWTTSSLGYIPGILASGVFPNLSYFDGQNADVRMIEYQAGPLYEITETNITRRVEYQGGTTWFNSFPSSVTVAFLRFPCQYGKMGNSSLFGFTGTTPPTSPSTGYSRVLLGNHPVYGQGLFVSRPGLGKGIGAATRDELIFDSTQENYSQILKSVTSLTLTRATLANPSLYDQTITFDNTGEIPAISVALLASDFTEDDARVEIVSTSTTSVVLRLPYYANNAGGSASNLNPTSATVRVVVLKKG